MSDEGHSSAHGANLIVEHYCEHQDANGMRCKKWGGFGRSSTKIEPARWWCWEHFPHKTYEQEQALRQRLEAAEHDKGPI